MLKEAFFSPSDTEMLQAMFDAFSQAAELNPEDGDDDDDELGDGEEGRGEGGGGGGLVFEHGRYVHCHAFTLMTLSFGLRPVPRHSYSARPVFFLRFFSLFLRIWRKEVTV